MKNIFGVNIIKTTILGAIIALLATSCVTPRRINYLQDMTHGSQIQIENKFEATIAPYDELVINVSTSSNSQELVAPFNLQNSYNVPSGNTSLGRGYLVDVNGNIDFPVLGKLRVAGLTRLRLQDTLSAMLKNGGYIDDPFVMVRFANFKIFYLTAGRGGSLNIPNERCTFLEALALLGDLDPLTRRDKIAVMREINGKMVMRYLDPRSSRVFEDPFFMLQQNDFIITDAYTSGTLRQQFDYWLGLGSTILSLASFVTSLAVLKSVNN